MAEDLAEHSYNKAEHNRLLQKLISRTRGSTRTGYSRHFTRTRHRELVGLRVSQVGGDGAGYDIKSFDIDDTDRLIEVKTTNG